MRYLDLALPLVFLCSMAIAGIGASALLSYHADNLARELETVKQEAIQHGYAEYTVNAAGEATWRWTDPPLRAATTEE